MDNCIIIIIVILSLYKYPIEQECNYFLICTPTVICTLTEAQRTLDQSDRRYRSYGGVRNDGSCEWRGVSLFGGMEWWNSGMTTPINCIL